MSSRQPQTTHICADSRIGSLCHDVAYALHMRRQNLVPLSCLYAKHFELVIEIVFHYCNTPPCHKINLFKRMMLLCCSLDSSSFSLRKYSFLSDDHLNCKMYYVWWFLIIINPAFDSTNDFHKTLSSRNRVCRILRSLSCSFTEIVLQFLLPFPLAIFRCIGNSICLMFFSCHNVYILLSLSGSLLVGESLVFVTRQFACWHTDVSR